MKINFTGHGLDVTPALEQFTNDKFAKLEKHFSRMTFINVTFHIENILQVAEANLGVYKNELHARAEANDMYAAVEMLVDKLDKQLIKYKEKSQDHRE